MRPSANLRFHKVAPEPEQLPTPAIEQGELYAEQFSRVQVTTIGIAVGKLVSPTSSTITSHAPFILLILQVQEELSSLGIKWRIRVGDPLTSVLCLSLEPTELYRPILT
jgi:hypothetical protein